MQFHKSVAGHLTPHKNLSVVNRSDNSNRTSCLVVSYFGAMRLTLVWHPPAANEHLTVEVRPEKVSQIFD